MRCPLVTTTSSWTWRAGWPSRTSITMTIMQVTMVFPTKTQTATKSSILPVQRAHLSQLPTTPAQVYDPLFFNQLFSFLVPYISVLLPILLPSGAFFAGKGGMQGLARRLFGGASSVNPTGGQRPSLQVFPTVSMVRISVTDSGAGISKVRCM